MHSTKHFYPSIMIVIGLYVYFVIFLLTAPIHFVLEKYEPRGTTTPPWGSFPEAAPFITPQKKQLVSPVSDS